MSNRKAQTLNPRPEDSERIAAEVVELGVTIRTFVSAMLDLWFELPLEEREARTSQQAEGKSRPSLSVRR
jgi:hypothetical protein